MMCSIVGPLNSHLWFNGDFKVDARHHSRKLLPASQSLEENAKLKKDWYSKHRSNNLTLPFLTNMVRRGECVSLILQILQTVLPQLFKNKHVLHRCFLYFLDVFLLFFESNCVNHGSLCGVLQKKTTSNCILQFKTKSVGLVTEW